MAEVRARASTYGKPLDVDPSTALLMEVHRSAGHVAWLNDAVSTQPDVRTHEAQVLVELYRREREHLVRVCRGALDVGVAERETPHPCSPQIGPRTLDLGRSPLDIEDRSRAKLKMALELTDQDFEKDTNFGKLNRIPHPPLAAFLQKHGYRTLGTRRLHEEISGED